MSARTIAVSCLVAAGLLAGCDSATPSSDASIDGVSADTPSTEVAVDASAADSSDASVANDGAADVTPSDVTDVSDAGLRRAWTPVRCAEANEAPLRDGTGPNGSVCTRVGAGLVAPFSGWPNVSGLASPIVYADGAAAAGGNGSPERPYASLADAFGALDASGGTVAARGSFTLSAPVVTRGATVFVGTGASGGTTVTVARGVAAFSVSGAGVSLAVRSIALRYAGGSAADAGVSGVAFSARTEASLSLTDVSIEDAASGVVCDGANLTADSVSVLRASQIAVLITGSGLGRLRRVLVRDGVLQGVRVDGAHLDMRESMVAAQGRQGIQLFHDGSASGGMRDCVAGTVGGSRDCLDRVVSLGNTSAALYLENSRVVEARRVSLSGTRGAPIAGGGTDGDGLLVLDGATVSLDPELSDDPANQGRGSEIVGNSRAGVVAQGAGATLTMHGALVASNGGPGVFAADRAVGREIMASAFVSNGGIGLGATPSASLVSIQCNGIFDTRMALVHTDRGSLMVGDGLSLSSAGMMASVVNNEVTANTRFGVVANETAGVAMGNHGALNGFSGVATYGSMQLFDDGSNHIGGAAPRPTSAPGVLDGM